MRLIGRPIWIFIPGLMFHELTFLKSILVSLNGGLDLGDGHVDDGYPGLNVSPQLARPCGVQFLGQAGQLIQVFGSLGVAFLERGCEMFPHPLEALVVLLNDLRKNLFIRDITSPQSQKIAQETTLGVSRRHQRS